MVAISQATYAFAPASFGLIRASLSNPGEAIVALVMAAVIVQTLAILSFYLGSTTRPLGKALY